MYLISDGGINTNILDTYESIMLTKYKSKIDGIKFDVRKTLDHIFVLSRYEELNKLTCGKGNVSEYNYSFIRKIKFPSHIFKYFIPTLEEILNRYNKNKIIVLELYSEDDLDRLFVLLIKYNYKYYFYSKDNNILNKLKKLDFDKIGNIISDRDILINKDNTFFINEHNSTK